jgi:dUTP pyrophosphatase
MKIKCKEIVKGCRFESIDKGDWIDLKSAETVQFTAPQANTLKKMTIDGKVIGYRDVDFVWSTIRLGIAMELPKGYEAVILPRSSTFKRWGLICVNSQGVIDNSYNGDSDEWKFPVVALGSSVVGKGDRVCQFRIQLSQKATIWQKIKWLFTSKIKFEWVDSLGNQDRGGFGSTGV